MNIMISCPLLGRFLSPAKLWIAASPRVVSLSVFFFFSRRISNRELSFRNSKKTQFSPTLSPTPQVDRFIPSRSALDLDIAHYNLVKENANSNDHDLANEVTSPSKVRRPTTRDLGKFSPGET